MENDTKNTVKDFFSKFNHKFLSIAAIVLSIISIIFSSISLARGSRREREFFGRRPSEMREYMWENNFQSPNFDKNSCCNRNFNYNKNFGGNRGGNRKFGDNNNFFNNPYDNRNFNNDNDFGKKRFNDFDNDKDNNVSRDKNSSDRSAKNGGPTTAPDIESPQANSNSYKNSFY